MPENRAVGQVKAADAPLRQPGFLAQPSALTFGSPADLAMGWDGTVWAVDGQGAPHVFDPIAGAWQPHGTGVDAVAWVRSDGGKPDGLVVFRGPEVWASVNPPSAQQSGGTVEATRLEPIASAWPLLPPSFAQGVDGAADIGDTLYLFKAGRYVRGDGVGAVASLTALKGWPATGGFADGVVDLVGSGYGDSQVVFIRGSQVLIVDFAKPAVIWGPADLSAGFGGAVLDCLRAGGVEALLYDGTVSSAATKILAFSGPSVVAYSGSRASTATSETYLPQAYPGWPVLWNPRLLHAPAGRVGALWAAATPGTGNLLTHDGESWSEAGLPAGAGAASVAVGADGAVFAAGGSMLYHLDAGGAVPQWQALAKAPEALAQVAVGDAGHVWVRSGGKVSRYGGSTSAGGAFAPVNLGTAVAHVAANADGSLWHCDGSHATAHRFISEGTAPPEALSVAAGAGGVQKVASTGYGRGWVLTGQGDSPQLYAYESPYLFKTGPSYILKGSGVLATGAGALYLTTVTDGGQPTEAGHLVALDALTGQERWRRDVPKTTFTVPVYDPVLQMVYIAGTDGYVSALDVHTGATTWEYQTGSVVDAAPALDGGLLYFGARDGRVRCLDVAKALADWTASKTEPTPVWVTPGPVIAGTVARMTAPLVTGGKLYAGAWVTVPGAAQSYQLALCQVDAVAGTVDWAVQVTGQTPDQPSGPALLPLFPPVLGQAQFGSVVAPAVIANASTDLVAVRIDATTGPAATWVFSPGRGTSFFGGLTLRGNRLFVGAEASQLLIIDPTTSRVLYQTPEDSSSANGAVYTTPVVSGPPGAETVFYAPFGPGIAEVHTLDVASGTIAVLPTGQTAVAATSAVGDDGILYVAGAKMLADSGLGQVFALRMDAAAAAAHDVIAESQLMQDYDEPAGGQLTAVARYQTHLTVVDDAGTPRPFTALRVWADAPVTVQVDGNPFPIGPQTAAPVQTAADGSVSIVSDAGRLAATPLRVWASFMDPAERIVVYPDAEFHQRLASVIADPKGDDPTSINLSTAKPYGGTPLFSSQAQAQQVAQAVRQLAGAAGLGGGGSVSAAAGTGVADAPARPAALLAPAGRRRAPAFAQTGTAGRYVPYADLPGMAYFAADTPAARAVVTGAALGLVADAGAGTLTVTSVATAAATADTLQGQAPTDVGGFFSFWDSLWDDIKKGLAQLKHVVAIVARDVGVVIHYVIQGVEHVFRAVVNSVEDVLATVASFLLSLLPQKDLVAIAQALGISLEAFRIPEAQKAIEGWINNGLGSYVSALKTHVKQPLDTFFETREELISGYFDQIRTALGPLVNEPVLALLSAPSGAADASPISTTAGAGATEHTLFSIRPKGGTQKVSHAVICTWALHKLTHHLGDVGPAAAGAAGAPGDTPPPPLLLAFIDGFLQRLKSDPVLAPIVANLRADFSNTRVNSIHSLVDFLEGLTVGELLDAFETLIVGALAVINAFFDGLIGEAEDLVEWIKYLLNEPINVPVLTAVYRALTGQQLTLLSLISFVCAIPLNLVLYLVDGAWPDFSDPSAGETGSLGLTTQAKAFGILNGLCSLANGAIRGVIDAYAGAAQGVGPGPVLGNVLVVFNFFRSLFAYPDISGTADPLDWEAWGVNILGTMVAFFIWTVCRPLSFAAKKPLQVLTSILTMCNSIASIFLFSYNWRDPGANHDKIHSIKFAGQLFSRVAGVVNPLKFFGDASGGESIVLVVGLDILGGIGAASCVWAVTGENWDK
jgi:outer membrane protein assembly factor BamB